MSAQAQQGARVPHPSGACLAGVTKPRGGRRIQRRQAGFTLLEVVVAMGILALSLGVLLESHMASLANVGRARDTTIAALLARSKMIDVEQKLFEDGFTLGEESDKGHFGDDGYKEFKWEYKITEIELDISSLTSLCGPLDTQVDRQEGAAADCEGLLSAFGAPLEALTEQLGRAVRAADLTVTWPAGRYEESMNFRWLVAREAFKTTGGLP